MPTPKLPWDVFCRVVDNHGDLGVCWRLACDLAERGERVRLWVDDATALAWMAPGGAAGVTVRRWDEAEAAGEAPGDVVIEAFGCELPAPFVQRMASAARAPVWVNLEYLSAEAHVERLHRLASPQWAGAAAGLRKWFFYPGFTPRTGGLLRERGMLAWQHGFDAGAWLEARGLGPAPGERVVSLFCYAQPALDAWLDELCSAPTLLLATAGHAARQVQLLLGPGLRRGRLRAALVPALTQPDYDALLLASDLNFVRGEDSFVRAQWAGKPFVWQIYPQQDSAHARKLEAFLERHTRDADPALAGAVAHAWRLWNGLPTRAEAPPAAVQLPDQPSWQRHCNAWRAGLLAQPDLTTQLIGFARESR